MKTKYYKSIYQLADKYQLFDKIKSEFIIIDNNNQFIIASNGDKLLGLLEFNNDAFLEIINIEVHDYDINILSHLLSKLLIVNYQKKDIRFSKAIYSLLEKLVCDFEITKEEDSYILRSNYKIKKLINVGNIPSGEKNNICDVSGVKVGQVTLKNGNINTGITAIIPHKHNLFKDKVIANTYVYNGFGKSIGLVQVEELGTVETPILLTNTLSAGIVSNYLIDYILDNNEDIGFTTGTVNPVVLECNDGTLNDIRSRTITKEDVYRAINHASDDFIQGDIGAGTGMTCHGHKGGIGSASRVISIDGNNYTIGVLVNSNFLGSTSKYLNFNSYPLGNKLNNHNESNDKGSIIIVVATDLPVDNRQLKRICKRAVLGIGNTGGFAGNGSGDIVIGFSTKNNIKHYPVNSFNNIKSIHDDYIDDCFKAVVDATEEAILNSLLFSNTVEGVRGNIANSINNKLDKFDNLLIEDIIGKNLIIPKKPTDL